MAQVAQPNAAELAVLSPAKINLNLRVCGTRRRDGYHEIESLVQPIGIFDAVRLRVDTSAAGVSLKTDSAEIPPAKGNTAFDAAGLFLKRAGIRARVEIFIEKKIPVGAGLGGGSGNAAAALVMLNTAFRSLSSAQLRGLAMEIGADVPLFINPAACSVSGAGETVEPLHDFPVLHYVVCCPEFSLDTGTVYKKWDELPAPRNPRSFRRLGDAEIFNDLQDAAFSIRPGIARLAGLIRRTYGVDVLMTGSGSAVFSVFESAPQAQKIFSQMSKDGMNCFLARGVSGWKTPDGEDFLPLYAE